ncbi:CGNR zinc finger domain-containing protein [Paenibacillus sp. ISL-20]|uniref:CGNR zinc finger domain-containing protein n=1 Tax=Paenibacillus sp. ISL-20 TaxID=2819163 RepID=UPI001BE94C61|nr:CGNR zinc finger domain-containing protein [Paenibacillus sp. ISL-20]MBT2764139.1 CGNR zinc finger domain-containing protein [Paenibacillus sp. ISL-20]
MLWDDFINSEWHDWRGSGRSEDRLAREDWLTDFINEYDLPIAVPLTSDGLGFLRQLRSFLLTCVQHIVAGESPSPKEIEELNRWMATGPVIRQLKINEDQKFVLAYTLQNPGLQAAAAEIAGSLALTIEQGELSRFRICTNPDCLWVYYDDTRNRSKRYCDDKMCGNLMKVRRFRAKKKQQSDSER